MTEADDMMTKIKGRGQRDGDENPWKGPVENEWPRLGE